MWGGMVRGATAGWKTAHKTCSGRVSLPPAPAPGTGNRRGAGRCRSGSGKAQAGALTASLGGEEQGRRCASPARGGRRGRCRRWPRPPSRAHPGLHRDDGDRSPGARRARFVFQRLEGVDEEVHEHLIDLAGPADHRRQVAEAARELDARGPQPGAEQHQGLLGAGVEVGGHVLPEAREKLCRFCTILTLRSTARRITVEMPARSSSRGIGSRAARRLQRLGGAPAADPPRRAGRRRAPRAARAKSSASGTAAPAMALRGC